MVWEDFHIEGLEVNTKPFVLTSNGRNISWHFSAVQKNNFHHKRGNMKIISNKIIKGLTVEVKYDNVDKALRKLKKSIDDDGRLDLVKERKHYQKPSVTKRLCKKSADHCVARAFSPQNRFNEGQENMAVLVSRILYLELRKQLQVVIRKATRYNQL